MKDINILKENGVNVAASLELFGDMETYDETLNDFLESVDQKLSDIKKYKEQVDMPNYAILVHSLKSDSKYLGFTKLADLSYQHELESKNSNIQFVN
ncbi:MAG: Hpt domain-containing protein, partial [Bacilli bacterium]